MAPPRPDSRPLDGTPPRDAVNAVFDAACMLVEAAAQLRRAADAPNAASAAPAVLGCLQEVQSQLAATAGALRDDAEAMLLTGRACAAPARQDRRERMRTGFANLEIALDDAAAAASAARSLAARALHGAQGRGA